MVRKVVGKINRALNQESVDLKPSIEAKTKAPRKVSAPRYAGLGPVYQDKEDF